MYVDFYAKCRESGMIATGIPPHLFTNYKIDNVQRSLEALEKRVDTLCEKLEDEFTELRETMKKSNESLPDQIITRLKEESMLADANAPVDQLTLRTAINLSQTVILQTIVEYGKNILMGNL
jgi:phage host-nuclease inhibitor protein Gam